MNQIVESFFAKKENIITAGLLEQLVRSQFNKLLKEEAAPAIPKNFGIKFSSIPEISVSELGWSSLVESGDGSTVKVSSEQRKQLEQYLNNIQGNDLAEKFKNISEFYTGDLNVLMEKGILDKSSRTTRIQQIMSYLVFIKTLTTIITNFNAAAAGFAFESFLGVLLGGEQVPTNSGTIADLKTSDGVGISLKLYSEKKVHVGGSFTDLVNDMINPKNPSKPFIRYVVAVKSLSGEALKMTGTIDVHQFDINLANIENVMSLGGKNSRLCIRLPVSFIKDGTDYSHLKKSYKPQEEIEEWFDAQVRKSEYAKDENFEQWYKILKQNEETEPKFFEKGKPDKLGILGKNSPGKTFINDLFVNMGEQGLLDNPEMASSARKTFVSDVTGEKKSWPSYASFFIDLYERAKDFAIVKGEATPQAMGEAKKRNTYTKNNLLTEKKAKEGVVAPSEELMPGILFASTEESVAYLNSIDRNPELKKKALKNTYGYLDIMQFGFTKLEMFELIAAAGQDQKVATLTVGKSSIEELLNRLKDAINTEVYEIFESLNVLTTNINSYFANGMVEDANATAAQQAAKNIDVKTALVQQQVKK